MSCVTVYPAPVSGKISAIPAKASLHRLLVAAALSDGPCRILFSGAVCDDVAATVSCIEALGGSVTREEDGFSVVPVRPDRTDRPLLDCRESGTTARFFLSVASVLTDGFTLTGRGRLVHRPFRDLIWALEAGGVSFDCSEESDVFLPLRAEGRLHPAEFVLPGHISSQYISGLLLALPLLGGGRIKLTTPPVSAPYLQMTMEVMAQFGVSVSIRNESGQTVFTVPNRKYRSPGRIAADGDWSAAAFYLTAGALGGPVTVTGLYGESAQGDRAIVRLLKESGADVICRGEQCRSASGSEPRPFVCDLEEIPDLAPILAVRAAYARGVSRLKNGGRLRLKESDRLSGLAEMIRSMGGCAEVSGDDLVIEGAGHLAGGRAVCPEDHRMMMAAFCAALGAEGPTVIPHMESAAKSDPAFFETMKQLGVRFETGDRL